MCKNIGALLEEAGIAAKELPVGFICECELIAYLGE